MKVVVRDVGTVVTGVDGAAGGCEKRYCETLRSPAPRIGRSRCALLLALVFPAVLVTVSGFLLAPMPRPAHKLERFDVIHTAIVALVGSHLGQTRVALLVVGLLVNVDALLAHAKHAVVLRLETAQLL